VQDEQTENNKFTKMYTAFNKFESPHIIQFGIPCKNLSMKKGMSRL